MHTTYHLNSVSEITADVVEAIKTTFKGKPNVLTAEEEWDLFDEQPIQ